MENIICFTQSFVEWVCEGSEDSKPTVESMSHNVPHVFQSFEGFHAFCSPAPFLKDKITKENVPLLYNNFKNGKHMSLRDYGKDSQLYDFLSSSTVL